MLSQKVKTNSKPSDELENFKKNYCSSIKVDNFSNVGYVPVMVDNYEHISIIQQNLLSAIQFVGEMVHHTNNLDNVANSIRTLTYLAQQFNLHDECIGLSELME